MWNIFNPYTLVRVGVMTDFLTMEINHHYFEADSIHFTIPFNEINYALLKIGNYIQRPTSPKAFVIHTVEVNQSEKMMYVYGYGLEFLLTQRVVVHPRNFGARAETIMHYLVIENMMEATQSNRNIPNFTRSANQLRGEMTDGSYWGESLYEIFVELGRTNDIGFRILFDPQTKTYQFSTYRGVDRSARQKEQQPIRWAREFNDTYDEALIQSVQNHKNMTYVVSGDAIPMTVMVGDENFDLSGIDRKETFVNAFDVTKTVQTEGGNPLTNIEIFNLLKTKGRLHLLNHLKENDYNFSLSPSINEIYGKDYNEGDTVSIVNQTFGIVEHKQIATVQEVVEGTRSSFAITFKE